MLTTKKKQKIIEEFKVHKSDTGSADVQVALLSQQIEQLVKHLKDHPKDNHSRRGLLKMVADRKALMNYLAKKDKKRHNTLAGKLDLKKK
ncbi:MAG: 30S ribosomal protein S15 [Candidatus Pacebacteria bacterium]|nr:30S ribosomal protein S15 [Candidatus Paceibacterota bacterium]NUQ56891.1 30S ribosomal protein S15 [Candidatus Paceibacter sp.]